MSPNAGGGSKIVIDAWLQYYKTPTFMDCTREVVARFHERHPDYEIRLHEHDYPKMPTEIARAVNDGVTPTIAQYYYTGARAAFDVVKNDGSRLYTSIQQAIGDRTEILGEPVLRDVPPPSRRYFQSHDGLDAMSPLFSTTVLYSNTTLLKKAGVTKIPETWAEIDAACRAVSKLSDGPSHAITWCNHGWMFMQALAGQGALLVDADNGRSGRAEKTFLDSDEVLAFVNWWQRLQKDGYYLYTGAQMDWVAAFGAFAEQQVAFLFTSSVDARRLTQLGRDRGFEVETSRLPYNGEVPYHGNIIGGDAIYLADGLDEATRDGALAFLQYLNNPENAIDRHKRTNYLPVSDTAVQLLEAEGWLDEHPHQRTARAQLDNSKIEPATIGALVGELPRLQDTLTRAMHDVMVSGADPVNRFAQANAEGQKLVDDYNAHTGPGRDLGSYRVH